MIDTSAASNSMKPFTAGQMAPYLSGAHRPVHSFQAEQELITWSQSATLPADRAVIIDSDREIDRVCAGIVRARIDRGEKPNTEDAWTGSVALALGVPVVTYDATGFADITGLEVILLVAP